MKRSKGGRLTLAKDSSRYTTIDMDSAHGPWGTQVMEKVFENGVITRDTTLAEIRKRVNEA